MIFRYGYLVLCLFAALSVSMTFSAAAQDIPTIEVKTSSMEKRDGFFPVYWDAVEGKIWLEIDVWDTDVLYVISLPAGLGSNDIGLDRGLLGGEQVVHFERIGPRVQMVAPNLRFRAISESEAERKAVEDAFAPSVVWGFTAAAITGSRVLVDATDFLLRDAMGVTRRLGNMGQGSFRLDEKRSAPYLPMIKAFPQNTELEARLTFLSDNPGSYVRSVASDPYAVTLRMRQSLVALPELGSYTSRPHDPRSGAYGIEYVDYATPIGEPKERRFTARHRLVKQNPEAEVSDPVEPIVYYLDRGTPEPVRSALLDGARWWTEAFEAAGFSNAFRVEIMPEDADPLDLRYNVIQWVHRATRGWSYGSTIQDPRTGEILKGHVSLGSLRVRQDYLIAEGLLAPYDSDSTSHGLPPENNPMLRMALARLRQLSAHEVGHTLGFMHNFAASVNDRASVMDYPAPLAQLVVDGSISLADAYDAGIGEWDKVTVRFSYTQFPDSVDERAALNAMLDEAYADGYYFITDNDARPAGGAHPNAHLWDNGVSALTSLEDVMQMRGAALSRFGLATLPEGRPLAQLEEVLVPVYLYHRYQVEAAVKLIGGVDYTYTVRGDARRLPEAVPANVQRAAVEILLQTVRPEVLRLPANIRTQLPPRPPGYGQHRELFVGHTGLTFDPYAPAEVAAGMVFDLLVHPERAARLVYQEDFDPNLPGLRDVLRQVFDEVWDVRVAGDPYDAELQRIVQQAWTDALLSLATSSNTAPAVRGLVLFHLREVMIWLENNPGRDLETIAHRDLVYDDIRRLMERQYQAMEARQEISTPPGMPIGQDEPDFLRRIQGRRSVLEALNWRECGL